MIIDKMIDDSLFDKEKLKGVAERTSE